VTTPRCAVLSSFDPPVVATQRWRLDLAYDGSGFNGFAYQPQFTTVVGALREVLKNTLQLNEEPLITGAGRTDTGVHAFGQVIHVDLPVSLFGNSRGPEEPRLTKALNLQLRGRIHVRNAQKVSTDFHARYSAQWREYRYLVLEGIRPSLALTDHFAWTVEGPLDLDAMNRVCQDVLGTHDFRAFCRRPTNSEADEPLLRNIISAHWDRREDNWTLSPDAAPVARLLIRGQSFCHNMVRCLTSTMVAIGQGRIPESTVKERLLSFDRDHLPSPAPASGLTLIGVGYEDLPEPPQVL